VSAASIALPRVVSNTRIADFFLLSTFFCLTFEKVHWNVVGAVGIADVLTIVFLVVFALQSRGPVPRTTVIVLGFFAAFLLVYLLGYFNLETKQALDQFTKGMVKVVLHFLFLACAIAYLARRGERFYWRALGWFTAGLAANSVYGVLQLLAARAGHNLDHTVLAPLTGGASSINIYGSVNGASVYRPNALTGDPNHLGIMLDVPLLALAPVYLRLERGHRLKWPLGITLGFMLLVLISTLSRSGALGLAAGLLVLALPYRRFVRTRALLAPLAGVAVVLAYALYSNRHFFTVVLRSRLQTSGKGTSAHFAGAEQLLRLLRLRHGKDELGAALLLGRADRRDRADRHAALHRLPALCVRALARGPCTRAQARRGARPDRCAHPPARVGDDRRARRDDGGEFLLPDDAVLLLLRVHRARARAAGGLCEAPLTCGRRACSRRSRACVYSASR
jgi:hypothetical protein